ncbi:MAG: filamentous hemagglutinin N-terminal domain-containing protein, partial [Cyanobacteriota bacterium]|nr:filamentous hemagglutinin N-terminal domain-containing protein [Cyanobacteriota bacterium]
MFSQHDNILLQINSSRLMANVATAAICLFWAIASTPAIATIGSDGTLSTTVTTPDNQNFTIDNGNRVGNNLFHSFSQFSIPTNGSALFNNADDITNIFNRVTGGSISNIDGLIQAKRNANVFLLNPNGIIFGPNARLDVGGSFIGTTANSIQFADGVAFSATHPNAAPLLTMSAPTGLQLGSNPGAIEVRGTGHQLSGGFPTPVFGTRGSSELRVKPGKTLALIGGEIALNGGVLSGEGGQLELGAVGAQNPNPVVQMAATATGWTFDYSQIQTFAPIQLSQRALVDGSGAIAGNIHLAGSNITLVDGAWLLLGNEGTQASGRIAIDASESLTLRRIDNRIMTLTTNSGKGGDIQISAPIVELLDFSSIFATTYGEGNGGNIAILANDSVQIRGLELDEIPLGFNSNLSTSTLGAGDAGQLRVSTRRLRLLPGGQLTSNTIGMGSGKGGEIVINATESVELIGKTPTSTGAVTITSQSFGSGRGGNLALNTARLSILDGGAISASNFSQGEGGTIAINASTSIEVRGSQFTRDLGTITSQISSTTSIPIPSIQRFFGLSPIPSGNAGRITLNTSQLAVTDGAEITALNQGIGQGGRIAANADRILLDTGGKLLVDTFSGEGGEIELNARDALILRRGSQITATADNAGNGGNITITAPAIVAFENSDIIANAFQGNGGNIAITTNGLFGTEFRPQLTPESDITASSQFGVDGVVEIDNLDTDPSTESAQLPEETSDPSQEISSGCSVSQGNRFTVTGRGGLPPNPNEGL